MQNGTLKGETESLIFTAQEQAIRTNVSKGKIDKLQQETKCRMSSTANETINHIVSECPKLAQRERHRERERQRERESERETERETERQREIERQRDKETETQRDTERQRDTESTNIGSRIHWEICGPNGIPVKLKWYEHQPEVVIENDS